MDHVGTLTRTAADAAIILDAIAGHDARDSATASSAASLSMPTLALGVRGLHFGVDWRFLERTCDADVIASLKDAAAVFQNLGAVFREVDIARVFNALPAHALQILSGAQTLATHEELYQKYACHYGPVLSKVLQAAKTIAPHQISDANHARAVFIRTLDDLMSGIDILMLPIMPWALQTAEATTSLLTKVGENGVSIGTFTGRFNVSGIPALALPCGFTDKGLPKSVQLAAARQQDDLLLRAAFAYELATAWHMKHPSN
jgi:amidase